MIFKKKIVMRMLLIKTFSTWYATKELNQSCTNEIKNNEIIKP